ncbi:AIG1 family protein [Entamoeba histolytica]|uniref:AIG1 family protein n=2 Tax=Entamoeba histolytica TaxID=5759 RepID=A0A175K0L2_ENTHI|nr:AIG1 family protein [Entamoeba histolytica]
MSVQNQKQTKLLLIGETGVGKSSLGNFILERTVFTVDYSTNSVKKDVAGYFGKYERKDLFVIDTPGLQDTQELNEKFLNDIVEYVKKQGGINGIILTIDFNEERFSANLQFIINVISDVFTIKDIWKRVCIVWNKCDIDEVRGIGKNNKVVKQQFKKDLVEFISQTNDDIEIPMYYVDLQPEEYDDIKRSEKEIERLIDYKHKYHFHFQIQTNDYLIDYII